MQYVLSDILPFGLQLHLDSIYAVRRNIHYIQLLSLTISLLIFESERDVEREFFPPLNWNIAVLYKYIQHKQLLLIQKFK